MMLKIHEIPFQNKLKYNKFILNCDIISQYQCFFYCGFDHINAAMVSKRESKKKKLYTIFKKVKVNTKI